MPIANLINGIIDLFMLVLLARVVLSWTNIHPNRNAAVRVVYQITEPVLAPIRSMLPRTAGIDLSPLVVWLLLALVKRLLWGLA